MPDLIVTAALGALDSFSKFLTSPAGQTFANINNQLIVDVLSKLHVKIVPDPPVVPKVQG